MVRALGLEAAPATSWREGDVPPQMLKLDRHELLRSGEISRARVGIWRDSGREFSAQTHETARLMGYEP